MALRLRVDPAGRIVSYQVTDQAPRRLFEAGVAEALRRARLPSDETAPLRELAHVIAFVLPGKHTPAWAASRLRPDH